MPVGARRPVRKRDSVAGLDPTAWAKPRMVISALLKCAAKRSLKRVMRYLIWMCFIVSMKHLLMLKRDHHFSVRTP